MIDTGGVVIEILPGRAGETVAEEIYRNLLVLYGTHTGEQALDLDYGIDSDYADYPMQGAQSLLIAEYVRKTQKYEPRARVSRVDWMPGESAGGSIIPKVVIEIV